MCTVEVDQIGFEGSNCGSELLYPFSEFFFFFNNNNESVALVVCHAVCSEPY